MADFQYSQTYNSFSGVDMQVTFGGKLIGELQGLSYTVTREKAPLYTMGSADPRSFSRGKRGIAGSCIFLVFDRSALLETMDRQYVANQYELFQFQNGGQPINSKRTGTQFSKVAGSVGSVTTSSGGTLPASTRSGSNIITNQKVLAKPNYHDQIPPFDIVVSAANEYGHMASMTIYGVEIMNCGSGLSIDDITTDEACTFVSTGIKPWNSQYHINLRDGYGSVPRQGYNNSFSGARGGQ